MRRIILVMAILSMGQPGWALDLLILQNGNTIECSVTEVDRKVIYFIQSEQAVIRKIPVDSLLLVEINSSKRSLIKQIKKTFKKRQNFAQVDRCFDGRNDADTFHKRGPGNFAVGFFFGVIGVIGTAVGNTRLPHYYPIQNTSNLSDPVYLRCFHKRAKEKNVGNALLGFGAFLLLYLTLQPF